MSVHRSLCSLVLVAGCVPERNGGDRPAVVPEWAEEIAPDVYWIGTDVDPATGEEVDGWMVIDRVEDDARDDTHLAKGGKPATVTCWASLGAAGWLAPEDWGMDPTNASGIADIM